MNAGLDSGIMDPTNKDMLGLVYATEALLGDVYKRQELVNLHGAFMSLKKENTNLTGWMRHWIFLESTESR